MKCIVLKSPCIWPNLALFKQQLFKDMIKYLQDKEKRGEYEIDFDNSILYNEDLVDDDSNKNKDIEDNKSTTENF
eukprot:14190617-Ditylum_brightwellii.AAC.1